ncbi:MAG: class I SAM-dependent methyltransferase [bacterium]
MNPFEFDCVADSYDLALSRDQVAMRNNGRFTYPSVFGSSGGKNFADILTDLDTVATSSMRFLEAGCGVGAFYEVLRMNGFEQSYTGLDFSREHIRRAAEHYPGGSFVAGSADDLPFEDNSFDVVFENNLFPFLIDPVMAIREMVRVSRGFVRFVCHATPVRGGVYCGQPIYTPVTAETGPDGDIRYVLSESIAPDLRPTHIMPKLMKESGAGSMKLVLAKVRKYYVNIDDLQAAIASLPVAVVRSSLSPVGRYPAVVTQRLVAGNSRAMLESLPDGRVSDDDVLIDIAGLDASFWLQKAD